MKLIFLLSTFQQNTSHFYIYLVELSGYKNVSDILITQFNPLAKETASEV